MADKVSFGIAGNQGLKHASQSNGRDAVRRALGGGRVLAAEMVPPKFGSARKKCRNHPNKGTAKLGQPDGVRADLTKTASRLKMPTSACAATSCRARMTSVTLTPDKR